MPEKGLKSSNKNINKLLDEVEGMNTKTSKEDEGLKPGSPTVTDDKRKTEKKKEYPSYKKGGKVKKTGLALVHKGERVVPRKKAESVEQFMKRRNKETGQKAKGSY